MSIGRFSDRHPTASSLLFIQSGASPTPSISRKHARYLGIFFGASLMNLNKPAPSPDFIFVASGLFFHFPSPNATHSLANPTCENRSARCVIAWLSIWNITSSIPRYSLSGFPTPSSPSPRSMTTGPPVASGNRCPNPNSSAAQIIPSLCSPRILTFSKVIKSSPCHLTHAPTCANATRIPSRRFVPPQTTLIVPRSVFISHKLSLSAFGCFSIFTTFPTTQFLSSAPCSSTSSTSATESVSASAIFLT